jgi:redox-sensitive bicupin YhaK (pirin superfamily)
MEILSYVLEGALSHEDSTGGGGVIRPGEIQFMRAGTGVTHSEFNASSSVPVHFLQIWIVPAERGLAPGYAQHAYDDDAARRGFLPLASGDGRDGTIRLRQDVTLSVAKLGPGQRAAYDLAPGRHAWLHVARGAAALNGQPLDAGDGAAVSGESRLEVEGRGEAELLLFDLA